MNIKKVVISLTAAALLLGSLAACGQKSADSANAVPQRAVYSAAYDTGDTSFETSMPVALSGNSKSAGGTSIALPENRKWVITMNLSAETENLDNALEQLSAKILELGGYVESQSVTGSAADTGRSRYAYLTVRVPADKVDGFAEDVSGMTNLVSSSRSVEDITLSYTDTEGHLNALKTEEARLLELMEKAETMSDLLDIEGRLTEVRYQLESYTSTLRLYDNQVDYATVTLRVTEVEKYTPVEEQGFWQKITDGLSDSIVDLGQSIVDFVSWVIIDLPYLVVIALIVWLVTALTRRSIRKRKAKKPTKDEKAE